MENVYVIASGQYEINSATGQDAWHWTTEPMFRIGELVGQCILDNIIKYEK